MKYICISCGKKEEFETTGQVKCSVCQRFNNDSSQVIENGVIVKHSSLGHIQKHECRECEDREREKNLPNVEQKVGKKPIKKGTGRRILRRRKL
jgi:hypothetical protein